MTLRTLSVTSAALLVAISLKPAYAQQVHAGGLGMQSCYVMMERVIRDVYYAETVAEWVAGFVSGANYLYISANKRYKDPSTLLAGGHSHIAKMVIARCQADPAQLVQTVAADIYWALPSKDWR